MAGRLVSRGAQRTRRLVAGLALLSVWSFGDAAAQLPPRAPGLVTGVGEVTPPGCDPGAYKMPFTASSDSGTVWIAARPAAVGVACPGVVYGSAGVFAGTWRPRDGGCLADVTGGPARLCIGAMPDRGVADGVPFRYCPDTRCFPGTAWVARV